MRTCIFRCSHQAKILETIENLWKPVSGLSCFNLLHIIENHYFKKYFPISGQLPILSGDPSVLKERYPHRAADALCSVYKYPSRGAYHNTCFQPHTLGNSEYHSWQFFPLSSPARHLPIHFETSLKTKGVYHHLSRWQSEAPKIVICLEVDGQVKKIIFSLEAEVFQVLAWRT